MIVDGRLGERGRIFLPVGANPTMGAVGGFDNLTSKLRMWSYLCAACMHMGFGISNQSLLGNIMVKTCRDNGRYSASS